MKNYIKMVLALPDEFFEGWQWKEGDEFFIKGYGENTRIIGDSVLLKGKPSYWKGYLVYGNWDYFQCIPIPNQEQLQEICLNYVNTSSEWKSPRTHRWLFSRFLDWINDHYDEAQDRNGREIWLMITMDGVYQKKWNDEAWV